MEGVQMFYRKDAVLVAVASLLASCGFAMADDNTAKLSLDPRVVTAAAPADQAPLMGLMDKAGMGAPLASAGVNLYGWIEAGYTYNHRHHGSSEPIAPGPFNHEVGNHFMMNQLVLRAEKIVDPTKLDVGGLIEVSYGTDMGFIHSSGWGFNGNDPTDDGNPFDSVPDKYRANYQFDVTQAYVDVGLPVGNGLTLRVGKFVTLLGYETIDPRGNPFYSHSYAFNALPFTHTGVLGIYKVNDQMTVTAGITRGWDMTMEDINGCAIDFLGQVAYQINPQIKAYLNLNVGPQNFDDTGHYRTVINPIVTWQVTDQLKVGVEGLYIYDGGMNANATGSTHAYGDVWGAVVYLGYTINEYVTANARIEKYHSYSSSVGPAAGFGGEGFVPTVNVYSTTLGVTITPLPKDPIGKNLSIRPEVRYDFSEDEVFFTGNQSFKDQLTFGADVIFKF